MVEGAGLLRAMCCTDAHNEELRRGIHAFDLGISAVRLLSEDEEKYRRAYEATLRVQSFVVCCVEQLL